MEHESVEHFLFRCAEHHAARSVIIDDINMIIPLQSVKVYLHCLNICSWHRTGTVTSVRRKTLLLNVLCSSFWIVSNASCDVTLLSANNLSTKRSTVRFLHCSYYRVFSGSLLCKFLPHRFYLAIFTVLLPGTSRPSTEINNNNNNWQGFFILSTNCCPYEFKTTLSHWPLATASVQLQN